MTDVHAELQAGHLGKALQLQREIYNRERHQNSSVHLHFASLLVLSQRLKEAFQVLKELPVLPPEGAELRLLIHGLSRRRRGKRTRFGVDLPRHALDRWRAFRALSAGESEQAMHWMDRADRLAPSLSGYVDGREFTDIRDSDDRFGQVLEVLRDGRWVWIPFEWLRKLTLQPSDGMFDAVFRKADLHFRDGLEWQVILPAVYATRTNDDDFLLGLDADWPDCGGPVCGVGARVLLIGEEECALENFTQIEFQ